MIKFKELAAAIIIIGAVSLSAQANSIFTPLNFGDAQYSKSSSTKIAATTPTIRTNSSQTAAPAVSTVGAKNMQSAISELDNAQVQVRNELLNYKTKYSEVDAKYTTIKTERSNLAKQIRDCERKIRRLDNAKEKIRKNMAGE